jgi:hypothetical protein
MASIYASRQIAIDKKSENKALPFIHVYLIKWEDKTAAGGIFQLSEPSMVQASGVVPFCLSILLV